MNAPVDSVSPGTAAAGGPGAAPPWWSTLTAKVVLSYPFTGPGLPVWGLVALLAAVPYGSLLGWPISLWVMVRVIESTMRGERRIPPLPRGPDVRRELELFVRALAVTGVILVPLWAVFAAGLVRRSYPDVPGPELVLGLGLFGTLVAAVFIPMALVRVVQGAAIAEALNRQLLVADLKDRMRFVAGLFLCLILFGGFAAIVLTSLLDRFGPPGAFVARAVSYGLQVAVAFVTGLAVMPPEEKEEPLPEGWTLEKG